MPRTRRQARQQRNAAILRASARRSRRELALRHGLTERQVYNILAAARRAARP